MFPGYLVYKPILQMVDLNIPKSSFFGLRYFFVGSIIEVLAIKGVQPIVGWGWMADFGDI